MTDEQFTEVWEEQREKYRRQLQEGCIAQYLDDAKLSAAEWETICGRVVALPETLEVKEIAETLETAFQLDDEQRHQLEKFPTQFGQTGVDIAQTILAENVAALGLVKLGEVTEPVRALIVLAPDRDQPTAKAA